jgi:hypothetical protein
VGELAVVELEPAAALQLEEELPAFAVDQEGGLALVESHVRMAMVAMPMLRTIPMTTTQITTFVSCLFCIVFETVDTWRE